MNETVSTPRITVTQLAQMIDHTLLKPDARERDLRRLCDEARDHDFKMVAINSAPVAFCHEQLKDTSVHVGAAIGFPLGQTTIEAKVFEAKNAIEHGADEIDYVLNIARLKDAHLEYIRDEMERVVDVCRAAHVTSKVILETCYLNDGEKIIACRIAREVRPDFVKTSTGFGTAGASVDDVRLMKREVGDAVRVKAAGGIRSLRDALAMIEAGATRIGTSRGVEIVEELEKERG